MVRDNVTFRFRIDMSQMTVKGREAIAILDELQRKSNSTGASVTKLGNDTKITGDKMVSASVNFKQQHKVCLTYLQQQFKHLLPYLI